MTPSLRESVVRDYLAALAEFEAAAGLLARGDAVLVDGLAPFADLADHLRTDAAPTPAALGSDGLWRPRDPAGLGGITDVYEVPGRFTFQGDDDANLRALGSRVASARVELGRRLARLEQLASAPSRIAAAAEQLERSELAHSRAQEAELLAQFEPEAAQLRELCHRLLEAVRAQRRPDLSRLDSADALYQEYVGRVGSLYAKSLPVLREAIAALSRVARCEVPPSWPDALPFAEHLADEFRTAPGTDTPAVRQLRELLETLAQQEASLLRAQDELGVQLRRVDGEVAAMVQREVELLKDVEAAKRSLRWAGRVEGLERVRAALAQVRAEGQARTQAMMAAQAEQQRLRGEVAAQQTEATEWAQAAQAKDAAVAKHRAEEPSLFGKDEWRRRLLELEDEATDLRAGLQLRQQRIVDTNAEGARQRAREQSEAGALTVLAQQADEGRRQEERAMRELLDAERELGVALPARALGSAQAEEQLAAAVSARNALRARIEATTADARRVKEETDRAAVQLKQLAAERSRAESAMGVAMRQAAAAQEEQLRALAVRRQAAFESHAGQVLAGLEESLAQVDRNFIEPARRAMLVRAGVMSDAPVALRARGAALEAAFPQLRASWIAVADAAADALRRVDADFLGTIGARARAAWRAP